MTDTTSIYPHHHSKPRRVTILSALAGLLLWLCLAAAAHAAEPLVIVVSGIKGDALKNVQDSLVLPEGLVREGTVDLLWLERFAKQAVDKSRMALEPFGYYNALVTVAVEAAGKGYRLLVTVVPGEAVLLTDVTVTLSGPGKDEKRLQRLTAAFPLKKGDVLLQPTYEEGKAAITTRARDLGYLDADFSRHEIRIARTATTAAVDLVLETGERYYFGETAIKGAPNYPGSFLGRHLTYTPGEVFSYPRLGETQRNFTNSERFSEVIITPEKQDAEALRVPVTVQLKEGPRISIRPGIGYGTDTGARFTIRYRDLNMFHLGHELFSNLYIAERLQGLVTGYIFPSSRDVRTSTSLQLNLQQEDTSTYNSRILALELARNRSFGTGKLGTAYVKAQYEDYSVGDQKSTARLLLPGVRFSDDRYDNPIRPRRGFRYALETRGTHQFLGSDTALVQFLAEGSYLLPLPWRLALHTRAKAGTTVLNDPLRDIPPSLRFFAGGDQSVRGYSYKSLGPRDAKGQVVGGTQLLTGSIELERALFKDWGVSVFYDVGNTFNSWSAAKMAQGAGVGLHYYTSVGALNLSVARPLGVDNPSFHFHFTVGFEL
jgi:translocation and assembly module TamA